MSFAAKNHTNPIVIDATGYTPYVVKRAEEATKRQKSDNAKDSRDAVAIKDYWIKERFFSDIKNYLHHHETDLFRSHWECKADRKGLYSRVRWEMDKINEKRLAQLEQRKVKLKELLEKEQDMYFAEEKANQPTTKMMQADMSERYANIMKQKEMERQKIAQEKRDQQFRLNCDELRGKIKKKISIATAAEGKILAQQKTHLMKAMDEEEVMYAEGWKQDAEAKCKAEAEKARRQKQRDVEYGEYIKGQMEGTNLMKYDVPGQNDERQLMEEQARLVQLEKEWEIMQQKLKKERTRKDLDKCLKDKLRRRAKEVQEDLMLDLYFLEQIISSDIEKKQAQEKKKALRKDQEDYLAYLSEQIKKEAEFEKNLEKLYQEESDKMWERREEQWAAQRRMREKLNKKAVEEFREQIRNKMERCREVEKMKLEYDEEILRQVKKDQEEMEEQKWKAKEKSKLVHDEIVEQIKEKEQREREDKVRQQQEAEQRKREEEELEAKIQKVLEQAKIDNLHPFRIKHLNKTL